MNHASFRFYEELNDFLPSRNRKKSFQYPFNGTPSVKDAIEALGVPHVEVDLCKDCNRIYWEGSHFERMKNYIDKLIKDVN